VSSPPTLWRFPTRWNNFIYTLSVATLIVPALTVLVPLYKFIVDMHGINTYWAIVLIHATFFLPTVIFLYTGFIRTIPRELDEAALIDGCSRYSIFFRIIFPLLKPVTASVIIVIMLGVGTITLLPFFLQRRAVQTVPLVLSQFFPISDQHSSGCSWQSAKHGTMTIVYIFLQKYFISGLAEGL
jgi:raffinose/stachyose/melibiose transport system permease protein